MGLIFLHASPPANIHELCVILSSFITQRLPMMRKALLYIACIVAASSLQGCFTGVEGTKAITQKDVEKAYSGDDKADVPTIEIRLDTFPHWETGKRFYVTDNNIKYIFTPSQQLSVDTLQLQGKEIAYDGYTISMSIDGRPVVNTYFKYGTTSLQYNTNRTMDDITGYADRFEVPFLVDMDEVTRLRDVLKGRSLFIKTSIWYDAAGKMTWGRKYVNVTITDVLPGDKVFPYKVEFQDSGRTAYVFMSYRDNYLHRSFNDLFSTTDIRERYPLITDENWQRIINGQVALNMTREECRLSIGAPNNLEKVPTYNGVREYWYYANGAYLIFDEEGLLTTFRL